MFAFHSRLALIETRLLTIDRADTPSDIRNGRTTAIATTTATCTPDRMSPFESLCKLPHTSVLYKIYYIILYELSYIYRRVHIEFLLWWYATVFSKKHAPCWCLAYRCRYSRKLAIHSARGPCLILLIAHAHTSSPASSISLSFAAALIW